MESLKPTFREYPSIQLSTRQNFVNRLKEMGHTAPEIIWTASEKIHGSNFSVNCDGHTVRYGRRNDYITKDIPVGEEKVDSYFVQAFYSAPSLVGRFHHKLGDLFKSLQESFPTIKSYTLYGEFFGGNWVEKTESKAKAVQTGITYTPNHEFLVFDANIKTNDEQDFWIDSLDLEKYVGKFLATVPIYLKGSFEEIYGVNTKIDSTIPELLHLKKVENNLIEGMVLRPNKTIFIDDERVILKKKNAEFLEKAPVEGKKGPAKKEEKEVAPELVEPLNSLSLYLNDNRVESALSKFPGVKDRNKLKKEILEDIVKDAEKDEIQKPNGEVWKRVLAEMDRRVLKALNEYLSTH